MANFTKSRSSTTNNNNNDAQPSTTNNNDHHDDNIKTNDNSNNNNDNNESLLAGRLKKTPSESPDVPGREACSAIGRFVVNKVDGNFHFALGRGMIPQKFDS
jgi:hypothetical protein